MQNFQIIFLWTRTYSENFKSTTAYFKSITAYFPIPGQFQASPGDQDIYTLCSLSLADIGKAEMYATTGPCKEIEMSHLQKVI